MKEHHNKLFSINSYPRIRMRRNRMHEFSRRLVSENNLTVDDLIYPIFITYGVNKKEKINSMPGIYRYTVDNIPRILDKASKYKIPMVSLFPQTPNKKKDLSGTEALNENNLVCRGIREIKKRYKGMGVMSDVALDPYTSHGHDGLLINGKIHNDKTLEVLVQQSLLQAEMGCDVIAPSDMMDGRIGKIRKALDKKKFQDVQILSYAAKYASSFYGPFRDAVGSKNLLKGDKKTYQMDFKNSDEALREVALDIREGADMVMVKPGMPYLDIIKSVKEKFKIPVFAYQVSGEYSLIANEIKKKLVNEDIIYESLVGFKRAGANAIVSYYADRLDQIIK